MFDDLKAELRLRGFTNNTVKSYVRHNELFLRSSSKNPKDIQETDVKSYLSGQISDGKSAKTVALSKAALKFYYDEMLKKGIVSFKTPKTSKKLPVVLSKTEVRSVIEHASTKKSRLLLTLLYSSGLRLSECINLRKKDIELYERIGWVRGGKGGKDRMFILSNAAIELLGKHVTRLNAESPIFTKADGSKISPRNVQKIVERAAKKAKIEKRVSPHTFRHTFATHLLENGTDIRKIQELLGHANLQTTQIYTKVSTEELKRVKSPMDLL